MLKGEQLQLALEALKDALTGVPFLSRQYLLSFQSLEEPQMQEIMLRFLQQTLAYIENNTKLALYPRRKTNLPKTPREAYENKQKYQRYFQSQEAFLFPTWENLNPVQQNLFLGNSFVYQPGTISWELLTDEQIKFLRNKIIYDGSKVGDEERIDGQNRSLITLMNRHIIKIHSFRMEALNGSALGVPFLNRSYDPATELIIYHNSGDIQIIPMMAMVSGLMSNGSGGYSTSVGYGQKMPALPQIARIDYSYGFTEIPLDLLRGIAVLTANKVFLGLGSLLTKGLMNFSVQGFSAGFGQGLYKQIMEEYAKEAASILENYRQPAFSSWAS